MLIKHVYRHPVREAELQAARDGRSVDGVEVDEGRAREDFLVFFECVRPYDVYYYCLSLFSGGCSFVFGTLKTIVFVQVMDVFLG